MQPRVVFVKEKSTEPQNPINILRKMDATFFFWPPILEKGTHLYFFHKLNAWYAFGKKQVISYILT